VSCLAAPGSALDASLSQNKHRKEEKLCAFGPSHQRKSPQCLVELPFYIKRHFVYIFYLAGERASDLCFNWSEQNNVHIFICAQINLLVSFELLALEACKIFMSFFLPQRLDLGNS